MRHGADCRKGTRRCSTAQRRVLGERRDVHTGSLSCRTLSGGDWVAGLGSGMGVPIRCRVVQRGAGAATECAGSRNCVLSCIGRGSARPTPHLICGGRWRHGTEGPGTRPCPVIHFGPGDSTKRTIYSGLQCIAMISLSAHQSMMALGIVALLNKKKRPKLWASVLLSDHFPRQMEASTNCHMTLTQRHCSNNAKDDVYINKHIRQSAPSSTPQSWRAAGLACGGPYTPILGHFWSIRGASCGHIAKIEEETPSLTQSCFGRVTTVCDGGAILAPLPGRCGRRWPHTSGWAPCGGLAGPRVHQYAGLGARLGQAEGGRPQKVRGVVGGMGGPQNWISSGVARAAA